MLSDEVRAYLVDVNGVGGTVLLPPESQTPLDPPFRD
jgi:hypothetical protein